MRDWLSHRVVSSPDDTALVRAEDGESWTYTDLDQLVSETAGRLVAHGIESGDRLGVLTPPYVGTVGLIHAAMRIGATFVPLGEGLTERELAERIDRTDLAAVVCAEPTEDEAIGAVERSDSVPVFSVDEPAAEAVTGVHAVEPDPVEPPEWTFSDTLCILFTSGTTGDPKPVPLTAGNVYSSAIASAFRLGVNGDDRWLVSLALHHMGGLAPVYRSALYGTTLVLREGFDPGGTADDIDTYDVTGVSLVPTMLQQMLDRRGTLSDSLRVVLLGGAPAPDELLERCRDYSVPVYPTYGMTEAASQIATATPRQTRDRLSTVGRPIFGTDVRIVDEDGEIVEPGAAGEVVVDGPTVTPGYLDPDSGEIDRSAFGAHGLHTGDVGRVDENGFLYVLNRLDDRILSGGENVEPGEVSGVLRGFPTIEDVAVVGIDDDVWGERVSALVAVGERIQTVSGDGLAESDSNGTGTDDADPNEESTDSGDESTDSGDENTDSGDENTDSGDENTDSGDENTDSGDEKTDSGDEVDETETERETGTERETESDTDGVTDEDTEVNPPIDEGALVEFARSRLSGFKIPKTIAYVDELPRTVSGTVDREAVREVLRTRGHDPRESLDNRLETAGFKPADPAEVSDSGDAADETAPAEASDTADETERMADETEQVADETEQVAEKNDGDEPKPR